MAAAQTRSTIAPLSGIYAIVNDTHHDPVALTRSIVDAGVRIVQYRAKRNFNVDHLREMRAITHGANAMLILNDRWNEVDRYDADGAHVGPDDAQWSELPQIRRALQGRIFGVSCGTPDEARIAQDAQVDYIGAGCVFATISKDDAGAPIGIEGLTSLLAVSRVPVAAIGGITAQNLQAVRDAGAAMAAVISAISAASDPAQAARDLVRAWQR